MLADGVHRDIPFAKYLELPYISKHALDDVAKSPRTYRYAKAHPKAATPAQALGTLVHTMVLEPERLGTVCIWDGAVRRGKAWDAFKAKHEGCQIVTASEWDQAQAMAVRISGHFEARKAFEGGMAEVTLVWCDHETQAMCKARPDYINGALVDLKCSNGAHVDAFQRACVTYRYHVQEAFYLEAANQCGIDVDGFRFVVVDTNPPHDVAVYELSMSAIGLGSMLWKRDLKRLVDCMSNDLWPGLPDEVQTLDLPEWAYHKEGVSGSDIVIF